MGSQETFKIFCGNLSSMTTGNELYNLFSKHGSVVEADVIAGKNFGFVHMSSETEGMNALCSLQGFILNGEKMVVQRAINSKRASATANLLTTKKSIIGRGVSSLDDFDSIYEVNDNYSVFTQDTSYLMKQPMPSSSPVNHNISINPNASDNSSGRPSPLLLSSASSTSYTPEHHIHHKPVENSIINNHFENLLVNQDDKSMCGMCNEEYNNHIHLPKILSCKHTFCLDCLTSLAKGFEIKCPFGCPYITVLHESGVTGLTTNQTKVIKQDRIPDNQNGHSFDQQEICSLCYCSPPQDICSMQKHKILKEAEAIQILKPQLRNLLEFSVHNLRNVMAIQATLKERMQYTLHSINKFSEELKLKIEGEELEQKIQQSLLVDLHDMNDTLANITSVNELLQKLNKVTGSTHNITSKFHQCFAKDTVNGALQSIILELKEPLPNSTLSQLGFSTKEAFSLASSLKENADKGNFANVLLIYLLSDLLLTRYRPPTMNHPFGFTPFPHSFGVPSQTYSPHNYPQVNSLPEPEPEKETEEMLFVAEHPDVFDINSVIETTKVIESTVLVNGSVNNASNCSPPVVSSALSLGLSNLSLIGSEFQSFYEEADNNNEQIEKDNTAPRPVSYLDALRKPPKQTGMDNHGKQLTRSVPSPVKPCTKFPHCWMIVSVNGTNMGRIIFQLRPDKAPNMCDNFIGLCTGRSGYGYKGTHFFKSGDGFLVGGDVEHDNGTGGYSVYDRKKFEADLCPLKDDVGMVRFKGIGTSDKGRGMVGSQFMIWYTEREFKKFSFSLVFGKVVDGLEIVQEAANHILHKDAVKVEECGAI